MFDTSYVHFTYILRTNVSYFPCQTFIPILRSRCFIRDEYINYAIVDITVWLVLYLWSYVILWGYSSYTVRM